MVATFRALSLASPVRESLESECRRAVGLSGCRAVGPQSIQNFNFDRHPIQPLPRGHLDINPGALTYL
jgi:hypothetical protein